MTSPSCWSFSLRGLELIIVVMEFSRSPIKWKLCLCRKINIDLKADHTLEFTPLNYSFTNSLFTEKEIAFLSFDLVDIPISRSPRTTQRVVWQIMKFERRLIDSVIARQSPSVLILSQWNSEAIIDQAQTMPDRDISRFKWSFTALSRVILCVFVALRNLSQVLSRRVFESNRFSNFKYFQGLQVHSKPYHKWDFTVKPKPNKILLLYKNSSWLEVTRHGRKACNHN